MKRLFVILIVMCICTCSAIAGAQTVTIIEVKGKVMVKQADDARWRLARVGKVLEKDAQLKTYPRAECAIAFDTRLSNILTIKENSQIRIESLIPSRIGLPQGRVFAVIENLASIQEFQIKTPVAIAGVRGTGESVSAKEEGSAIHCYEGSLSIIGLDILENSTAGQNLSGGMGIDVDANGFLGEAFELTAQDIDDWDSFRQDIADLRSRVETRGGEQEPDLAVEDIQEPEPAPQDMGEQDTSLRDIIQERQSTTNEETLLKERREGESPQEQISDQGTMGL